jgi:hypothetical protein
MRTGIHKFRQGVLRAEVEMVRGTHPTWLTFSEVEGLIK